MSGTNHLDKVLLHVGGLSPAGAGVVGLAGGDLGLVRLHLGLAVTQEGRVDSDVSTGSTWTRSSINLENVLFVVKCNERFSPILLLQSARVCPCSPAVEADLLPLKIFFEKKKYFKIFLRSTDWSGDIAAHSVLEDGGVALEVVLLLLLLGDDLGVVLRPLQLPEEVGDLSVEHLQSQSLLCRAEG